MANEPLQALTDARIFTGEAFVENHALLVQGSRIADIVPQNRIPAEAKVISCRERLLAPGFIDCQVNGGGNVLFNANPTAEAVLRIAKAHRKFGTMRILPT